MRSRLALLALLALGGCSALGSLVSPAPAQVGVTVYTLDECYAVADSVVANAIASGLVTNATTIADIKRGSQAAHDGLVAASQAQASGSSSAAELYESARAAIVSFEGTAIAAGILLPESAIPPAATPAS